jgi:hypothetical protein
LQITHFSHNELPLKEGDKVKMAFWEIDAHGKDCLYQWLFLFFGLKNTLIKFHQFMDQMLVNFGFVK